MDRPAFGHWTIFCALCTELRKIKVDNGKVYAPAFCVLFRIAAVCGDYYFFGVLLQRDCIGCAFGFGPLCAEQLLPALFYCGIGVYVRLWPV